MLPFLVAHVWTIVLTCNAIGSSFWALWVTKSIRALKKELRTAKIDGAFIAEEPTIH
jgi:hypothetical protein